MNNDRALMDALIRKDLAMFIAVMAAIVDPRLTYRDNFHIHAMAFELMRLYRGETNTLVITLPPRHLKSICASVCFVAWVLGLNPKLRIVCVSHTERLAIDLHNACRRLMSHPDYRRIFPNTIIGPKNTETKFETTAGGSRTAFSMEGPITGIGGDIFIIDDPLKAEDAFSEVMREKCESIYRNTLATRHDNPNDPRVAILAQRLHEGDLTGLVLAAGNCRHLNLAAIAEEDESIQIGPALFHHRKRGEALHPEHMSLETLEQQRRTIGDNTFAAQYQQKPSPQGGAVFKKAWLKYYDPPFARRPQGEQVFISVDAAAKAGDHNDYSVCTVWVRRGNAFYLIDVLRERLEFTELVQAVMDLRRKHSARTVLIEDTSAGTQLIDVLKRKPSGPSVIRIKVTANKLERALGATTVFDAGRVLFPSSAPWLADLIHELLTFPRSKHDDQVDSIVQFLIWAVRARSEPVPALGAQLFSGGGYNWSEEY